MVHPVESKGTPRGRDDHEYTPQDRIVPLVSNGIACLRNGKTRSFESTESNVLNHPKIGGDFGRHITG